MKRDAIILLAFFVSIFLLAQLGGGCSTHASAPTESWGHHGWPITNQAR